jgi:hypothetical protein
MPVIYDAQIEQFAPKISGILRNMRDHFTKANSNTDVRFIQYRLDPKGQWSMRDLDPNKPLRDAGIST